GRDGPLRAGPIRPRPLRPGRVPSGQVPSDQVPSGRDGPLRSGPVRPGPLRPFPDGPVPPRSPEEFVECEEPVDHGGNATAQQELGHGCVKFGGQAHGDVDHTRVQCRALDGIECAEPRSFLRGSKPCIRYTGHYFITTLLYSFFLGCFGVD
uniref:TM2 domain containing 2 n=1 Tax=Anas platyrhynchos platyrhynchos TaxID=8840 RepID=A0A493TM64_ANAPP